MAFGSPFPLIDVLRQHDVPFVIIGGLAVNFHGYIRATEDTDIVFARSAASEPRLLAALQQVHAYWIGDTIDPTTGMEYVHAVTEAYLRSTHLMMLGTDHGYLDIFDYVPGVPELTVTELIASAVPTDRGLFASLSDLRRMKQASRRAIDCIDLEKLPLS
jgi:hypothetical protein